MATVLQEKIQPNQRPKVDAKVDGNVTKHRRNGNGALDQSEFQAKFFEATPPSKDGMRVSEEEYWEIYYHDPDYYYEWNNGILEEKPVSTILGAEQLSWVGDVAKTVIETTPIARLVNLDIGFRMALQTGTSIRKPDLFVVCNNNPVPAHDDDITYHGIPDICFEALSTSKPSEIRRDVATKRGEYERAGVREYYILDPGGEHTVFYLKKNVCAPKKNDYVLQKRMHVPSKNDRKKNRF